MPKYATTDEKITAALSEVFGEPVQMSFSMRLRNRFLRFRGCDGWRAKAAVVAQLTAHLLTLAAIISGALALAGLLRPTLDDARAAVLVPAIYAIIAGIAAVAMRNWVGRELTCATNSFGNDCPRCDSKAPFPGIAK